MSAATPVPQILLFIGSKWNSIYMHIITPWKMFCRDFDDINSLLCITADVDYIRPDWRVPIDALMLRYDADDPCVVADVGGTITKLCMYDVDITYESLKGFAEAALGRPLVRRTPT